MSGAKVRNSEEYYINIYVFMGVEENFRRCSAAKAWMLMYCQALLIPGNALNSYIIYLPSQKLNTMSPRAMTSAEVTYISRNGLVLWVKDKEYYLPYEKYPWFKKATVDDIFNVRLLGRDHIRWEALDVDLSLGILQNPDQYPLIAK